MGQRGWGGWGVRPCCVDPRHTHTHTPQAHLPPPPPPPHSLRREVGEALVGMGLVGAALSLFEELELWDSLIVCYRLLDKKVQVRGGVWLGGVGWGAVGR